MAGAEKGLVLVVEDEPRDRRPRRPLPAPRRVRRAGRARRRRRGSRPCGGCGPPRSCSTSGCPGWTASRSADGCAPRTTGRRCCSSPPATTRSTACSAWRWAPTTTSPSRSARASSWRACGPCCAAPGASPSGEEVLAVGEVRIEVDRRRAHAAGAEVALTSTEFDLLTHLMRAPGRVFTREQLLSAVWGYTASAGTRTVDVHVAQLRAKLGPAQPASAPCGASATRRTGPDAPVARVAGGGQLPGRRAGRGGGRGGRRVAAGLRDRPPDDAGRAGPGGRHRRGPARRPRARRQPRPGAAGGGVAQARADAAGPGRRHRAAAPRRARERARSGTALTEANAERALAGVPVSASVDVDGRTYVVEARPRAERGVRVGPPVGHGPAGQRPHPRATSASRCSRASRWRSSSGWSSAR